MSISCDFKVLIIIITLVKSKALWPGFETKHKNRSTGRPVSRTYITINDNLSTREISRVDQYL